MQQVRFTRRICVEFRGVLQVGQHDKTADIEAATTVASGTNGLAAWRTCSILALLFSYAIVMACQEKGSCCQATKNEDSCSYHGTGIHVSSEGTNPRSSFNFES